LEVKGLKGRIREALERDYVWAFTTYFAEGFPFTIIRTVSAVFFRDMKVGLEAVGLTSMFGLPWVLKFLWSPQVDRYETKRKWMLGTQFLLLCMMAAAAAVSPFPSGPTAIAALFFFGAVIAATHDIAIDGYYLEALDRAGQARYVGWRVMAYRIAMMTGTGVIVTIGALAGWPVAFAAAAAIFGLFFAYHSFFLREVQTAGRRFSELSRRIVQPRAVLWLAAAITAVLALKKGLGSEEFSRIKESYPTFKDVGFAHIAGVVLLAAVAAVAVMGGRIRKWLRANPDSYYGRTFVSFAERERFGVVLAFIILLRAGEFMLGSMISPFIVDLGLKAHYGWISSAVGLPASIAGAMIGGRMIAKHDLKKVVWPFVLAQNVTLLGYMWVAFRLEPVLAANAGLENPQAADTGSIALVAAAHLFEQFAGGLGTSVLMTYLMRLCKAEFKAAHYAIGSGLMSLSGLFSGSASGFLAAWLGYGWTFGISFLVSIPAMCLIPFLPHLTREPAGR
jgi:PAT family beta-lactamase induction signal transducer AmpG